MRTEILIKKAGEKSGMGVVLVSVAPLHAIVLMVDTAKELSTFCLEDDQPSGCFETPGLRSAKKPLANPRGVRRGKAKKDRLNQTKHKV